MQNEPTRLSIGQAAEYLGVSIDTLRRWEKKGRISPYRSPGGHRYFDKEDLNKLFDKRYVRDPASQSETKTESVEEHTTTSLPNQNISHPPQEPPISRPPVRPTATRLIPQVEQVKTTIESTAKPITQRPLTNEHRKQLDDILEKKTTEKRAVKKTEKMPLSQIIGIAAIIIFIIIDIIILYLYFSTKRSLLSPMS